MAVINRLVSAWNAFANAPTENQETYYSGGGEHYTVRPDRSRIRYTNERSIISSIYNRIAIDVSGVAIKHIVLDSSGRFKMNKQSALNDALMFEPNLDQGPRQFRQDIALSLFDKGTVAIVPVDSSIDPASGEIQDVFTLRVGHIVGWKPQHIKVSVYNERTGKRQDIVIEKRFAAVVENPLYSVMNEQNSTLQRLIRKLNLLDAVDEATSSGKLDLIIQLPYVIKSEARRNQAEQRRKDIEFQLKGSQYGIAYTDGTEKITQLNRPAENNLLTQIEYLTNMLYGQLGLTEEIMNGTADEAAMINYFNRTVEPIVEAIIEAMQRSFIGPMTVSKQERIAFFKDPFKLVPVASLAEIADKFTRNEILSANEIRGYMGIPPSDDPKADKLQNSNMPQPSGNTSVANSMEGSQNGT